MVAARSSSLTLLYCLYLSSCLEWVHSFNSISKFTASKIAKTTKRKFYDGAPQQASSRSCLQLRQRRGRQSLVPQQAVQSPSETSIWEDMAKVFHPEDEWEDTEKMKAYVQTVTILRTAIPSLFIASSANIAYPYVAIWLANLINDSGVFAVVAQDASQYIQNILTTSGLTFSLLVGQTYYFMYQQQEAIYLALFDEVTTAKSLLEQVALVSQGRQSLHERILSCIQEYVEEDLTKFNDIEPAVLISKRPVDDPLEEILYLTSVGEPSLIYQTVRSLRQARAYRLGALQRKLPTIQMILLWTLAGIVLFTFPLLGAGSQTIGGMQILRVQGWYLSFIVFGISIVMSVVNELRRPGEVGAYNARTVLNVMVAGLEEELELRVKGMKKPIIGTEPSVDSDGYFDFYDDKNKIDNDNFITPTETVDSKVVDVDSGLESTGTDNVDRMSPFGRLRRKLLGRK